MDRDKLRQECIKRQRGLCVMCGHGVEDDAAVHEAIVKRSDLPDDDRIFEPWNCVAVHNSNPGCDFPHDPWGNTRWYDEVCAAYLIQAHGADYLAERIRELGMTIWTSRMQAIFALMDKSNKNCASANTSIDQKNP